MYQTLEVNDFRYAQLQSSILNKTSSQLNITSKFNLKAKFSNIENSLKSIQEDIDQLSTSTSVSSS